MYALFFENFGQEPDDYRQILAFIVGGYNNRVFVCVRGVIVALHVESHVVSERVHQS